MSYPDPNFAPPAGPVYPQPAPGYLAYPPMGYAVAPEHPQATTAMVLGILGLVFCGFTAPFALFIGRKSMREIDASGGRFGGRGQAQAGFVMGIIGTVFLTLGFLYVLFRFVVFGLASVPTR